MSWTITKWVKKRDQGAKYETFIWVVATFALRQIKVKRRQRWHSCGLNRPRHAPISYTMNFFTFMGTDFLIKVKNMYHTMAVFHLTHCSPPLACWSLYPLVVPVCHCHSQSQAVVTSRTSSSSFSSSTSSFSTSSSSSKLLPHQAIDPTLSGPQSQGSQLEFKPHCQP